MGRRWTIFNSNTNMSLDVIYIPIWEDRFMEQGMYIITYLYIFCEYFCENWTMKITHN